VRRGDGLKGDAVGDGGDADEESRSAERRTGERPLSASIASTTHPVRCVPDRHGCASHSIPQSLASPPTCSRNVRESGAEAKEWANDAGRKDKHCGHKSGGASSRGERPRMGASAAPGEVLDPMKKGM
jgi:hypothetical protein